MIRPPELVSTYAQLEEDTGLCEGLNLRACIKRHYEHLAKLQGLHAPHKRMRIIERANDKGLKYNEATCSWFIETNYVWEDIDTSEDWLKNNLEVNMERGINERN
jgi:hypothetical protein